MIAVGKKNVRQGADIYHIHINHVRHNAQIIILLLAHQLPHQLQEFLELHRLLSF